MKKEVFAKRLVNLRKKKGYTQAELAEKLNVSNKTVSRWETAEGYPDISLL
ncbi:MAG: helix-turn-helix transcriptional regulator, partial [Clostridium sp.]